MMAIKYFSESKLVAVIEDVLNEENKATQPLFDSTDLEENFEIISLTNDVAFIHRSFSSEKYILEEEILHGRNGCKWNIFILTKKRRSLVRNERQQIKKKLQKSKIFLEAFKFNYGAIE